MAFRRARVLVAGVELPVYSGNTLVIGSGAAGLNAALQLVRHGQSDIAIATERWGGGTSCNAGSDKQTYYKLAVAGGAADSPRLLAEDLVAGGSMHGDLALCEAQHSAQAFFDLVSLGVPFPHDLHGGFVGYRTDNDPRGRATSAGPRTSQIMSACLGRAVRAAGVEVFDRHQVVALLTRGRGGEKHVCGALAIDRERTDSETFGLVLFNCTNVVLAVGGPGGMYEASVYPPSQLGATGLGLRIGATAQNLTESQHGLASLSFRWNVSGSYQQVVPCYISCDRHGGDEREFLSEVFPDLKTLANAEFRKGYEWPFDCRRIQGFGSSLIDLLVHRERALRGRRVFLDYTRNPSGVRASEEFSLGLLDFEARTYLERSRALEQKPIERLLAMNPLAVEIYREHDIDLARDRLEIAVCAQHSNGGLSVNHWWESPVKHLFPVGEVAGTHGVRRPGGAALNAGQVGGLRAALYIARRYREEPLSPAEVAAATEPQISEVLDFATRLREKGRGERQLVPGQLLREIGKRMSACAAHVRDPEKVASAVGAAWDCYERARHEMEASRPSTVAAAFHALDLALTHAVYLQALHDYLQRGGKSRGSSIVLDPQGESRCAALDDTFRYSCNTPEAFVDHHIQGIALDGAMRPQVTWVPIRPIPDEDAWFERVWADYREDRVVR
ncbi:MAG: FAD-binding protein [Planctomycetota bacterium]